MVWVILISRTTPDRAAAPPPSLGRERGPGQPIGQAFRQVSELGKGQAHTTVLNSHFQEREQC